MIGVAAIDKREDTVGISCKWKTLNAGLHTEMWNMKIIQIHTSVIISFTMCIHIEKKAKKSEKTVDARHHCFCKNG